MKNLKQLLLVPIAPAVAALGIGFVCVSAAYAQPRGFGAPPILNGNYGSEGSGTVNGEPVTEISHWVFSQNKLVGFSQAINWGGKLTIPGTTPGVGVADGPRNSDGARPGFCAMALSGGPTTPQNGGVPQLIGALSVDLEMSSGGGLGCPFNHPHDAGAPQPTEESYLIISENGGNEFSYSETGDNPSVSCGVPNCNGLGLPMTIAGHAVKFSTH